MPLFTEWGIELEEQYHMPERATREIKYMDVPALMEKLSRRKLTNQPETQASSEDDEESMWTE